MSLASKCPLNFARGRDRPFPTKLEIIAIMVAAHQVKCRWITNVPLLAMITNTNRNLNTYLIENAAIFNLWIWSKFLCPLVLSPLWIMFVLTPQIQFAFNANTCHDKLKNFWEHCSYAGCVWTWTLWPPPIPWKITMTAKYQNKIQESIS